MNSEQINEILNLLHTIADRKTANRIALFSMVISGIALISSIFFNYRTGKAIY